MDIKYNPDIQQIVKYDPKIGLTPDDPIATQEEIKQWASENPMPLDEPKKQDPRLLNEVIESLTVKQTPDSTSIEEDVETMTEKV
tara:strand:+ start:517 stop:771 length:255 start_codon:yes stop_codon:yes gene_type:complete